MKGLIHHLEINVSNLQQSIEFWSWLLEDLGYKPFQKWDKGKSWKLGDSYLVFVQTEDRFLSTAFHRGRTGLNHIAFHGESREHVNHMTAKLEERGVSILYRNHHPFAGGEQHYAVFFEDPDRMKVEIVSPN
ncbi:VOC family protein [Cytobacillus purgationiresistens]|uniref:Catechol 2,3-dioxygenase-like lactoylglutathione lyase family enzyme n=1 Tax=Cytobacillus purgationiresistens TaxID=863449 RepID=A0ABU0AGS7_9BACI|nr:VOC family protein [Cytobacillus purgationiresistens]MDQ0270459.1 catechol 2,3-dioxygenase-like lactoylglutathione lyase family enzyme [Cytobacillus purgationiresistens]